MVNESLMLPEPELLNPVAPPAPVAVQVSVLMAGFEASGSATVTPLAVEGPEFEATIV
jgi:hypothetical protein